MDEQKEVKSEVPIEQIIKDRAVSIQLAKDLIRYGDMEKKYKQDQLDKGKILENSQSTLYTTASFPKDDIKPEFVLKIEIEQLERRMKKAKKDLKIMEELQVEDKKKLK